MSVLVAESSITERRQLSESLDLIHDILSQINQQVDSRQKQERLQEICRKIDAKAFTLFHGDKFKVTTLCPLKHGPPRHRAIKMSNLNEYK